MAQSIDQLASLLDQASFSAKAVPQIVLSQKISLSEAYAIQAASLGKRYARGEQATGFKLGFTSKAKMEQMGVHEIIWGRLTDKMELKPGEDLQKEAFIHPRVEPEIAFLISERIDRVITLEEAPQFLSGVAGALEIIDSRYENFKFSLEDVVADNCSSAAYIIGDWMAPDTPFAAREITLKINGESVQEGNSNAILGNPLASLVELARILSENGEAIEAGTVVLAGAATSAVYLKSGDKVEGLFEGMGSVQLTVTGA